MNFKFYIIFDEMARRIRFHLYNAIYHVMLRGNNGDKIFYSDADRCRMCLFMQQGVEKFGHKIHAFCFMTNHIHLAIQVRDIPLSKIMQHLAFRYAQYINDKYERKGHVFQGRFHSILVDGQGRFNELIRYIHLNPVRAGLVNTPENYVWSSHRAYMQLCEYTWLTQDRVLQWFGEVRHEAVSKFEKFVFLGIGIVNESNMKTGNRNGILGDEDFIEKVTASLQIKNPSQEIELNDVILIICKFYKTSLVILSTKDKNSFNIHVRSVLAFLSREKGVSLRLLGKTLNREASGISKLASRLDNNLSTEIKNELDQLRELINNKSSLSKPSPELVDTSPIHQLPSLTPDS